MMTLGQFHLLLCHEVILRGLFCKGTTKFVYRPKGGLDDAISTLVNMFKHLEPLSVCEGLLFY